MENPSPFPGDYAARNAALMPIADSYGEIAALWRAEANEAAAYARATDDPAEQAAYRQREIDALAIESTARHLQTVVRRFYSRWQILD